MTAETELRTLVTCSGKAFILSASSAQILRHLIRLGWASYATLERTTDIPLPSLYVFVMRLRRRGLVTASGPSRSRTLHPADDITFSLARYIG